MKMLLFWISLFGTSYSYFVYPMILLALPKRRRLRLQTSVTTPSVSIIITAHNELARIHDKLKNTLEIDYPKDRFEILVASDASVDGTDEIVRSYKSSGIRLVRADIRKGKEYAQLLAIREAKGDILIFSDVAANLPSNSIRKMMDNFNDAKVGAVSSEDRFVNRDTGATGEGTYVRYEMWLRRLESEFNSLVGLSGSFFAARREVCEEWDTQVPSDFNTALNCISKNLVAVTDPNVLGFYSDVTDDKSEYRRKVRTVIRGLSAIFRRPHVLNPLANTRFAFQVWGHKIARWLVPWCLIFLLISSWMLADQHPFYMAVFLAQVLFYVIAFLGLIIKRCRKHWLIKVPFFFLQGNAAIAHATLAFLFGKRITIWEPSKR